MIECLFYTYVYCIRCNVLNSLELLNIFVVEELYIYI